MQLELAAVRDVAADVAVAHVKWRMSGHEVGGPEQTSEPRIGIWSWVIRGRDGRLEIVCSHNTDTMEVPPTHPLAGDKT